ncbi:MAG: hypothetical protein GX455_07760 [Phycisphaerae bacterium]|nr:hypothetical protein [Phycisphaerae bacterium]
MPQKIVLSIEEVRVIAELRETPTAEAILRMLPLSGETQRWGGEIYFPVPASLPLETDSRESLLPGELGYWPEGKMFCIFFGATPASEGDEIRPASAVNVFGRLIGRWSPIKQIPAGKTIRVEALTEDTTIETTEPVESQDKPAEDCMYSPTAFTGEPKPEPQTETVTPSATEETPKSYSPTPLPESGLFESRPEELESEPAVELSGEETAPAGEDIFEATEIDEGMTPTTPKAKSFIDTAISFTRMRGVRLLAAGIVILLLIVLISRFFTDPFKSELADLRRELGEQKKTLDTLNQTIPKLQTDLKAAGDSTRGQVNQQFSAFKTQIDAQLSAMRKQLSEGGQGQGVWVKNPTNHHSYCVSPVPLPWHQARDMAKKMGGYLATLTDAKENEWVVATFGEQTEYWIGLDDELEERKWIWTSGEKFEYANWAPGEPDNYRKNQHYVVINSIVPDKGNLEPGRWKDISCNEIHLAIIERNQ